MSARISQEQKKEIAYSAAFAMIRNARAVLDSCEIGECAPATDMMDRLTLDAFEIHRPDLVSRDMYNQLNLSWRVSSSVFNQLIQKAESVLMERLAMSATILLGEDQAVHWMETASAFPDDGLNERIARAIQEDLDRRSS
jgi:hypothetical protein